MHAEQLQQVTDVAGVLQHELQAVLVEMADQQTQAFPVGHAAAPSVVLLVATPVGHGRCPVCSAYHRRADMGMPFLWSKPFALRTLFEYADMILGKHPDLFG